MILYINSKARIPVLRDKFTISRSYSLTDSKLHTRSRHSRAHHRYKKTTTPWRKQRTSATSVFPISMTDPTFWRKSWKQRNYTALYHEYLYTVVLPSCLSVACGKFKTANPKRPKRPAPGARPKPAAKRRRGGKGWGFTRGNTPKSRTLWIRRKDRWKP